ncbi:ferredoxin [Streptomyces sp. NPDC015492]|uniref:ferredoxin n=1 Tax=Streptomyces sp. NPDC015492 TaxID=3364958 RepID=UPI0036F53BAF
MSAAGPGTGRSLVQIVIDRQRCIGAGQCALTAPGVFTQDDDGLSELVPHGAEGNGGALAREAARACPVAAIAVRAV